MIRFQNRLLLLLTTILVVSFILLGFFVHNALSNEMQMTNQRVLTSIVKDLEANIHQSKAHTKTHLKNYDILNHNQVLILKDNNDILFKTDRVNVSKFTKPFQNYQTLKPNTKKYIYDGEQSLSRMLYITKDQHKIYVISQFNDINLMKNKLWTYIFIILLILLPIIYIIVRYINKSYIQPINEVTYASRLLADGNYKVRVPESSVTETKDLYISTNILARTLQDLNNEQKLQRNRLETTLQNIPSATMLVNNHGEVVIVNEMYETLFNKGQSIKRAHYEKIIHIHEVKRMIKEALITEKPINETLALKVNVHTKYFDAAVVPVLSRTRKKLEGVVIVLHDITQLKTLEQMRKDFVANVSHELKTPITSIKGFTETLLDGAKENPETLDLFLDIILKEANRIQVLVSELLELSKIEQANHFTMSKVNVSKKVFSSIEVMHPLAEKKQIEFDIQLEKDVFISAEPSKLKQVIINLLSNAINYSPQNAKVAVHVKKSDTHAIIEIIDEGIGIDEEERERIFERFYRVDKARSRDSGGTGLGLAIVKHIVEVFNGDIEVDSELGKGSTFRVIFPLA